MNYYLYFDDQNQGPYTLEVLNEYRANGQVSDDMPCCREGDSDWSTVGALLGSQAPSGSGIKFKENPASTQSETATPPMPEASASGSELVPHTQYILRRKWLKLIGLAFRVLAPDQSMAFYVEMKAFKLKEDIRIYTDEAKTNEVLRIHARNIIDFSATYDVVESSSGNPIGSLQRQGMKSLLRDEWIVRDSAENQIAILREDSMGLALLRRFATDIIPQHYEIMMGDNKVCTCHQNFNPFSLKITLDFSHDHANRFDRRLGLAASILLRAIEGRQK